VENAVKHGIATRVNGGRILVEARRSPRVLRVVIENSYDIDGAGPRPGGLGLANVRGRLESRYGNEASLDAGARGGAWRVELLLPAEEATS